MVQSSKESRDRLARPLLQLRGVGPERSSQLARLGLHTIGELLLHRPLRYEDRRHIASIAEVQLHVPTTVRGQVVALGVKRFARGTKSVFELILDDGTGRLHCRWWNLPYMQNYFRQGDEVLAYGKPIAVKPRTIDHPETEVIEGGAEASIHLNRIAPVYPLTEGLPQRWLRALIWQALEEFGREIVDPWPQRLLPNYPGRAQAVHDLHFPAELIDAERARERLALDELIALQVELQRRRKMLLARADAPRCKGDNRLVKPFLAQLGFELTAAQIHVLRELRQDMSHGAPMRRLLQGDVGSGKTVVAACCALFALESGFSVALMAPTEILAEQHFRVFRRWFEPMGVSVHLQTGSIKTLPDGNQPMLPLAREKEPRETSAPSTRPNPTLVIGTHALIQSSFSPENLGLVIIDEQHKFGVAQREELVRKGHNPHLLIMTATPIPRTLGLTVYADLDISVIDQVPPGRTPVKTFVRTAANLPKVWAFLRCKLAEGRQAYVVLPRIDDTAAGAKAINTERVALEKDLAPSKVGVVHGRLTSEEKQAIMEAFHRNTVHVLLSTSLIEVGIDVPNASLMLIENAEQFGLAQLHQLRGRIGRGAHEAYCILVARSKSADAQQRLKILAESTDGFRIAEADLALRGPGDFLGRDQSGLPPLRFADLVRDLPLVQEARRIAKQLLADKVKAP